MIVRYLTRNGVVLFTMSVKDILEKPGTSVSVSYFSRGTLVCVIKIQYVGF